MTDNASAPRSRRALLAAAAGGAAALAASAALPLTAMAANGEPVLQGHGSPENDTTGTTSINNSMPNSDAFAAQAAGTGFGITGSSTGGAGIVGWSISDPNLPPANGAYTGIYGWSPAGPIDGPVGAGVVGESEDWGVYGHGYVGVYGYGANGVVGEASSVSGAGVTAYGLGANDLALDVVGKVRFNRSGRTSVAAGQSTKTIKLAGVSSSSRVFAVLHSNRSGRYVRAVVPTAGSFKIYLNATVSSSTYVAWFVLN
jgi:hypothetical protein